ncbi:MAG: hypothetical protein CVT95_06410 [Bacteroidetes bacterium HGW-Bacteroidetes-12]|nr:MAG: hypothetical protein CVT95_06410 [Bacteroidetes bacterium HGW-Bacteroidetes-12]
MKKVMVISLVLIVALLCEKIPFDYRNKYVGDYIFTKRYHFFYPPNNTIDTTYSDVIEGYVRHGKESNQIELYYDNYINSFGENEKSIIQVIVTRTGVFENYSNPSGKFINSTNIEFTFPSKALGGIGGTTYTGIKKN